MADSPVVKDVILEVGKIEDGNLTTSVPVITGYEVYEWPGDSGNSCRECETVPEVRNSMTRFRDEDFPVKGYRMKIEKFESIGQPSNTYLTNPGNWADATMGMGGYPAMIQLSNASVYDDLYILTMKQADGSPASFNGIHYSLWDASETGYAVENHVDENREDTEQGRILYLQPKLSGSPMYLPQDGVAKELDFCLSFEIVDGWEDKLIVRGTARDNPATFLNSQGIDIDIDTFNDAEAFLGLFDCFISPYCHNANWFYYNDAVTWHPEYKAVHMSFCTNNGYDGSYKYSPTFQENGFFGIRSKKNLLLENGCGYTSAGCKIKMDIASINNVDLKVCFGNATNPYTQGGFNAGQYQYMVQNFTGSGSTNTTPWTWETFKTSGVKESCPYLWHDTKYNTGPYYNANSNLSMDVANVQIATGGGGVANYQKKIWESQHEFFRAVSTGNQPRVSIRSFEIYEVSPSTGDGGGLEIEVPIWGTETVNTATYTYQYLDILDRTKALLALTFNAADLRDPSKRAAGFSKTFEIPANNHNQKWIETLTGVGSQRDLEKISWHKARIKTNGIYVFEGWMRIEESTTGQGGSYKCHILQDPSHWPELIKNLKICELNFPTHEKSFDTITNSWSATVDQIPYVYPAISYGEWFQGANAPKSLVDFHPAVYVKAIVDRIFSDIDYNIESNFFNTDFFKKLIIPFSSGEGYDNSGDPLGEDGAFSVEATHPETQGLPTIPATGFNSFTYRRYHPNLHYEVDPAGIYSHNTSTSSINNGYVVPFTGRYVVQCDMEIKQSQGWGDGGIWVMACHINGGILNSTGNTAWNNTSSGLFNMGNGTNWIPTGAPWNAVGLNGYGVGWAFHSYASNGAWKTGNMAFEIDLQQGDKVQIGLYGRNNNNVSSDYGDFKNVNFLVFPHVSNTAVPATTVTLQKALPCIKQKDFLKGITNLFNLHWTSDEDTKTVFAEPYDDFYGSGKTIDWTDKLDHESWSDKFLIDELASTVKWKYKFDSADRIVELYNTSMETELWSLELTNGELYRKDEKDMGNTIFSPTFRIYSSNTGTGDKTWGTSNASGPIIPCMWAGNPMNWGWFNGTTRPPVSTKFNIRILNWGGMSPCSSWQFTDSNGVNHTFNEYPYAYTFNQTGNPVTAYEDNLAWYNVTSGQGFQRGLFERYYGQLYEKISGGAALRKCKMYLTPNDIALVDLRDIIKLQIDGVYTYWTINKIKDYQPGQDKLTVVELIEWKYGDGSRNVVGGDYSNLAGSAIPAGAGYTPQSVSYNFVTNFAGDGKTGKPVTGVTQNGIKFVNNITANILNEKTPKDNSKGVYDNKSTNKGISLSMSHKTTNRTKTNSIAIGDKLKAANNQIVLGRSNEYNPQDIFQIGTGYVDSEGNNVNLNAISVSQTGEVSFYGGEVKADFTTGDLTLTGDVYVSVRTGQFREDGTEIYEKKKLYLKNTPGSYGDSGNNTGY